MSYDYQEGLPVEARARYLDKLALVGVEKCPFKEPADSWTNNPKQWPTLEYHDVYNYLIKSPRLYSAETMENYRSLEAHVFFVSGWVQTAFHKSTKTDAYILKADVKPSWRVTDNPHHPWVALKKTGPVIAAHCDCMAGLGESCSHVGALLFKVEAAVRLGYTREACTDQPCVWNECFTKNVEPRRIADIRFYTDKAKDKVRKSKKARKESPAKSTYDEQQQFLGMLKNVKGECVGLSAFGDYAKNFAGRGPPPAPHTAHATSSAPRTAHATSPAPRTTHATSSAPRTAHAPSSAPSTAHATSPAPSTAHATSPQSLRDLYCDGFMPAGNTELEEKCRTVFENLNISEETTKRIEMQTRGQTTSSSWMSQRCGRVTASVAHECLRTNQDKPAPSLLKKICGVQSSSSLDRVPAIKWGRDHEEDGFRVYENVMTGTEKPAEVHLVNVSVHSGHSVQKSGLVICKDAPYFGASPDGMINCNSCGSGVLEIKCPFSCRDKSLHQAGHERSFCLDSNLNLRKDHPYYTQVEFQMSICNASYAHFVVWSTVDCAIVHVYRDENFVSKMRSLKTFWIRHILPELVTRRLELGIQAVASCAQEEDAVPTFCKCKTTSDEGSMVACDRCDDWFHPLCIGLKRLPNAKTWYCPDCRKAMKKSS